MPVVVDRGVQLSWTAIFKPGTSQKEQDRILNKFEARRYKHVRMRSIGRNWGLAFSSKILNIIL